MLSTLRRGVNSPDVPRQKSIYVRNLPIVGWLDGPARRAPAFASEGASADPTL